MLGLMNHQQMYNLPGEKSGRDFMSEIRWLYTMNVPGDSDCEAYVSPKSFLDYARKHFTETVCM